MSMNLFYEEYPTSIENDGKEIPIITDFRSYIQLLDMLKDDELSSNEKYQLLLQYFKKLPSDFSQAMDALIDFVTMKELPKCGVQEDGEIEESDVNKKELYSFSIDYPFIFSAFLQDYGINLREIPYLHWWEFCMLFDGLSEDTEIRKRIMYRNMNLNDIKDKDERSRVEKIQRLIRLPGNEPSDFDIGDAFGW